MRIVPTQTADLRWTEHARQKMRFYGLSESRLRRVLRHPARVEHGIAPTTPALPARQYTSTFGFV